MTRDQFKVLVIDDDPEMRDSLELLLQGGGFSVQLLDGATNVPEKIGEFHPDVVLCDVRMPGITGMELLKSLDTRASPPFVLMSAHGDIPTAVDAMQEGAYSFLEKPFEPRRLIKLLSNASQLNRLSNDNRRLRERLSTLSGLDRILLGNADSIVKLREEILDLGDCGANILILGETGTGKELVASALHSFGPASSEPFVPVNCAAIPLAQFEEHMFGIQDGPDGFLAKADGGTLFLDELETIPLEAQAKLIRVIETKQFSPVGTTELKTSNFQTLSASNANIEALLSDGRFREDLYYRLNTIILQLPALRDRRDDIPLLFTNFITLFSNAYEIPPPEMSSEDIAALLAHDWPGNVRELRAVSERRVIAARRGGGSVLTALQQGTDNDDVPETLREAVAAFERQLISKAIKTHNGRMDAIADALGIGRRTLNEKIVKLCLNKDDLLDK